MNMRKILAVMGVLAIAASPGWATGCNAFFGGGAQFVAPVQQFGYSQAFVQPFVQNYGVRQFGVGHVQQFVQPVAFRQNFRHGNSFAFRQGFRGPGRFRNSRQVVIQRNRGPFRSSAFIFR